MPSMLIDKRFANRNMIPMVTYILAVNAHNDLVRSSSKSSVHLWSLITAETAS